MSDTPRTDAACDRALQAPLAAVFPIMREEMQALERELNTARELHANAIHLLNEETLKRLDELK